MKKLMPLLLAAVVSACGAPDDTSPPDDTPPEEPPATSVSELLAETARAAPGVTSAAGRTSSSRFVMDVQVSSTSFQTTSASGQAFATLK